MEKIKTITPPRGLARLGFRLPIWLYRMGLGGLLGKRLLLLTHIGRKSGAVRQTVLEVVRYDPAAESFVVAAGFGQKSDWYRNLQVHPQATVQCGRKRWAMTAHFLPPDQAGEILVQYAQQYPLALKELSSFMGYRVDGSPESIRAMGQDLSMVEFRPTR